MITISLFTLFLCFWILFWFALFYAAIFEAKSEKFLGFLLFYVILFPVFIRIYAFNSYDVRPLQNIWISMLILSVLCIILIVYLMKYFGKLNENTFLKKFAMLYLKAMEQIFHFLISYLIIGKFFNKVFMFLINYINTKIKKLLFLTLTNFLPRIIFFSSLLWDINVNQELYYSLRLSILIIIPLIINFGLNMLYIYSEYNFEQLHRYVFFELDPLSEEEEKFIKLDPQKESRVKMWLKEPCQSTAVYGLFNTLSNTLPIYGSWFVWASETKELFESIIQKITFIFLGIQILCQICFILQQI